MKKLIVIAVVTFFSLQMNAQKKYEANWKSIDSRPVPTWFQNAKFGIFIHWGLFSVPAWGPTLKDSVGVYEMYGEWYWKRLMDPKSVSHPAFLKFHNKTYGEKFKYQDFAKDFKCELFDPKEWANIIENSGAKYVVLTSKHHEGFTMWPSKQSWNWNVMDLNPHRDLAGDLTTAVKAKGLRMGFYYSLYEWFNPLYESDINQYVDTRMMPQLKDLVTRYKPDVVWADGEWDHPSETWKSQQFLSWLYNDSPVKNDVVVNDRWGKETRGKHGGYHTTEYDLLEGDQSAKGKVMEHPWEECRGIGTSFGVNRNEYLDNYSTSKELIDVLIDKVARGGNLLLNIGPNADGTIPVIFQQRLRDMGNWLKVNSEAIYDTRKWENAPKVGKETKLFFTTKGNDLYAITTKWEDAPIIIQGVKAQNVKLLGFAGAVKAEANGGKLTIMPPVLSPATNPCSYAWVYKIEGGVKK